MFTYTSEGPFFKERKHSEAVAACHRHVAGVSCLVWGTTVPWNGFEFLPDYLVLSQKILLFEYMQLYFGISFDLRSRQHFFGSSSFSRPPLKLLTLGPNCYEDLGELWRVLLRLMNELRLQERLAYRRVSLKDQQQEASESYTMLLWRRMTVLLLNVKFLPLYANTLECRILFVKVLISQ